MMYVLIGVFAGLVVIGFITIWQGPIKQQSQDKLIPSSDNNVGMQRITQEHEGDGIDLLEVVEVKP